MTQRFAIGHLPHAPHIAANRLCAMRCDSIRAAISGDLTACNTVTSAGNGRPRVSRTRPMPWRLHHSTPLRFRSTSIRASTINNSGDGTGTTGRMSTRDTPKGFRASGSFTPGSPAHCERVTVWRQRQCPPRFNDLGTFIQPAFSDAVNPQTACAVTGVTGGGIRANSIGKPSVLISASPRRDVRSGDARMAGGLPSIIPYPD